MTLLHNLHKIANVATHAILLTKICLIICKFTLVINITTYIIAAYRVGSTERKFGRSQREKTNR